jgi:AAA15 family ATPase/GTPase
MKKIGNEIKWYKPFKLVERNKQLEQLTETQFTVINGYIDDKKELEMKVSNRELMILNLQEENKILKQQLKDKEDDRQSILEESFEKSKKITRKKKSI